MSPWTVEDHTADLAIAVRGASLSELFSEAVRAFHEVVGGGAPATCALESDVQAEGVDRVEVWVRWWRALLRQWTVEGRMPIEALRCDAEERRAGARLRCVPAAEVDLSRVTDVKAVTWHRAEVARDAAGWRGTIVLDV